MLCCQILKQPTIYMTVSLLSISLMMMAIVCNANNDIEQLSQGVRERKLTNAKLVRQGEWNFMVSLINKENELLCSGEIVSHYFVLTAAHCLILPLHLLKTVQVKFGPDPLNQLPDFGIEIKSVMIHPDYQFLEARYDIALIRLAHAIPTQYYHPVTLITSIFNLRKIRTFDIRPYIQDDDCITLGYGPPNRKNKNDIRLRQLRIPLVSEKTCRLRNGKNFTNFHDTFCASFIRQYSLKEISPPNMPSFSTTGGDSGGAIVCSLKPRSSQMSSMRKNYVLIGILSEQQAKGIVDRQSKTSQWHVFDRFVNLMFHYEWITRSLMNYVPTTAKELDKRFKESIELDEKNNKKREKIISEFQEWESERSKQ